MRGVPRFGWASGFLSASLLLATSALSACRGFGPPPPRLLEGLSSETRRVEATFERARARLTIESSGLSGTFEAALARRRGAHPAVRLKLFTDLGGAVLDIVATPTRIRGWFPQAGIVADWTRGEGELPRDLFVFLAVSLLEEGAPLEARRVLGARPTEAGWEVRIEPVIEGVVATLETSESGSVLARTYAVRGARWRETLESSTSPARRIEAPGFSLVLEDPRSSAAESLPAELFELVLPAGVDS